VECTYKNSYGGFNSKPNELRVDAFHPATVIKAIEIFTLSWISAMMLASGRSAILLCLVECFVLFNFCSCQHTTASLRISNRTISGDYGEGGGCKHATKYDATSVVSFPMCTGQTDQDLKNGMSIINLIASRGYLPTCRILQLLLWMSSEVHESKQLNRETFVDIGANIGSCTVAIAALGFPVIAAEPVQQHVDTIRGTMALNPSFQIDLNHIGISVSERKIRANFGHGNYLYHIIFILYVAMSIPFL
jgi:hypothetical protein